jgi:hypothetical protein
VLGRFVNEDPLGFLGGDTNLYSYVGNDPIGRINPSGLSWICPSSISWCPDQSASTGVAVSVPLAGRKDFSWWGTFANEFFKLSGGPGNVPTCAEETLTQIVGEFVPISPSGASIIQATAPTVQAAAMNSSIAGTQAGIDAYIAGRGLTVPFRSSVVRLMTAEGAETAVAVGARANLAVQTLAVDYAAVNSMLTTMDQARSGTCAAALPIF